jgi:TPR repeat protein
VDAFSYVPRATCLEAAAAGDKYAQMSLGNQEPHSAAGLAWHRAAAQQGLATAANMLGNRYLFGAGTRAREVDMPAGCEQSAGRGKLGGPAFYGAALFWFEKAAACAHPDAHTNIAYMHAEGLGVQRDAEEALRWYERAGALGIDLAEEEAYAACLKRARKARRQ